MSDTKVARFAAAFLAAVFVTIGLAATPAQSSDTGLMERLRARALTHSLKVVNNCRKTVWIQQQNVNGAPDIVKLRRGKKHVYRIDPDGDSSTRLWAKTQCNRQGQNCKVGQTIPPCPSGGCQAAFDSLFEATWSCVGPGCNIHTAQTNYDLSLVDGYTLPMILKARGSVKNDSCVNVNCKTLNVRNCPKDADLSSNGKYKEYKHVDLRARHPKTKRVIGCFSPCEKLTAGTAAGGFGYAAADPQAELYCCPDSVDKASCLSGPAPRTDYVKTVNRGCRKKAYTWAYDDANGLHVCQGITRITLNLCSTRKR